LLETPAEALKSAPDPALHRWQRHVLAPRELRVAGAVEEGGADHRPRPLVQLFHAAAQARRIVGLFDDVDRRRPLVDDVIGGLDLLRAGAART
jgi:hypothetical protein